VWPKLASRPVASVAIHRVTGGCEAYDPIVPVRWGIAGLPKGAGTVPIGGKGEQADESVERKHSRGADLGRYVHTNRQTNRPGHDGLGAGRGVTPEEPTAGNLHGGVCERGDVREVMVALNAHETGNGG